MRNDFIKDENVKKGGNVEMVKENKVTEMETEKVMGINLDKIVEFVLSVIKSYETTDGREKRYALMDLNGVTPMMYNEDFSDVECQYCERILDFMVLSNSVDFIKNLYSAEGNEIVNVYDTTKDIFVGSYNKIYRAMCEERDFLRSNIVRDYIFHKLPAAKELLDKFMEWYETEIDYSYMLSDYMDLLDCDGWSDINTYVGNYLTRVMQEEVNITDFTDFEEDSVEGALWDRLCGVIDGDFLWAEYDDALYSFRKEFIEEYK